MKKRREVLESPAGFGTVENEAGEAIARVAYRLVLSQEMLLAETFSGSEEIEGLKDASGQIKIVDESRTLPMTSPLMLRFEDGRGLPFVISNGDMVGRVFRILGAGALEEPVPEGAGG